MNADDILLEMKKLAQDNGVELTDNAINIARFRARAGIPLDKCACCRLDITKYCISIRCMDDIKKFGECGCRCFRLPSCK